MTIDDNSSIYVGGLPYDITEESLRRVFHIYGAVLAVKIINDRSVGGKCYGFVTFANPRSAMQAMKEMDGKTIDGRVVKVNEVRTRGGKSNFNNENSRHDLERRIDGDSTRDQGRDEDYDRQHHHEGHRQRSRDHNQSRERGHDHVRNRYVDERRFRNYNRHMDDVEQECGRKRERDWERESDKFIEQQKNRHHKSVDKDKHQQLDLLNRSRFDDSGSRELSMQSFNNDLDQHQQGENMIAVSNQKLEELRKEICQMEELAADKQEIVSKLHEKYLKLEDSLMSAKKLTSLRHIQFAKLQKCYLQMRNYDERFKKSEQELQWLIDSTMIEMGNDGGGIDDVIVTNGRT